MEKKMAGLSLLPMRNPVQHYDWGSFEVIAALQGRPVPSPRPEAELWMGAHSSAPSQVPWDGGWKPLSAVIEADPVRVLGASPTRRFGPRLPFLFKVLAARLPLSIQAHPNLEQAKAGFDREGRLDIPLDAPHRNYRDDNHKPEVICALSTFWALKGFRPRRETLALLGALQNRPELISLDALGSVPGPPGILRFFRSLLDLDQASRRKVTGVVTAALASTGRELPEVTWIQRLEKSYPGDPGVLCPILLNLVRLEAGEAIFLAPGELHSYLEGTGVELMANSDNVLRGGLTSKHVDVEELLDVLTFEEGPAAVSRGEQVRPFECCYEAPVREFRLSRIVVGDTPYQLSLDGTGVEIIFCAEGRFTVSTAATKSGNGLTFVQGESVFHPAAAGPYQVSGHGVLYRASLPN